MKHIVGGLIAALALSVAPAMAQDYPTKQIRLVIPYAPGGDSDYFGRLVADSLTKILGQTVFVDNKPGGGTAIGNVEVKNAEADGYTILSSSHALVTSANTLKEPGYAVEDFVPIALLSVDSNVLIVSEALGPKTLPDFIDYAKANAGKMSYGAQSPGSNGTILAINLAEQAGFEWTGIPFSGDSEHLLALMKGEIQGFFGSVALSKPHDLKGPDGNPLPKLLFLAIAGADRSKFLPDVPTFKELGYEDMEFNSWTAVYVKAGTPQPIVDRLRAAVVEMMAMPDVVKAFENRNVEQWKGDIPTFEKMIVDRGEQLRAYMEKTGMEKR